MKNGLMPLKLYPRDGFLKKNWESNIKKKPTHQIIISFYSSGYYSCLLVSKIFIKKVKAPATPTVEFLPQNVFVTLFLFSGCRGFSAGVNPTGFESLLFSFPLSPLMWFSHPRPKNGEPQLSDRSPLSHRSLPTSSSCYSGQCCPLVLPATAPFPVLEGKTERDGGMGRYWWIGEKTEKKGESKRSREGVHMSKQLKNTRRGRESSRLMFMKQMEWVCEIGEGREGDGE